MNVFFKQLYDAFNEHILSTLKESYTHIEQVLSSLFDELLDVVSHLFERLVNTLKKFEDDFKKIGNIARERSKEIAQIINKQWANVKRELDDICKLINEYINSFPGLEVIKEKYQEVSSTKYW